MTETVLPPSRALRWLAASTRGLLWLVLGIWLVLLASWAGLHGWIVPRINDWRPQLQARASQALGLPVRIAALTAHRNGLFPTLELSDVTLQGPDGGEALRLPRVVLTLSARSLLRLGVEQLFIDRPELQVRRLADGQLQVAGLPITPQGGGDSGGADWLLDQPEVVIRGGTLHWTDLQRQAPPLALADVDLLLRGGHWQHELRLDATPPAAWGERFTLQTRLREPLLALTGRAWERWSGPLYAHFTHVDVAQLKPYVDLGPVQLAQGRGALRAWIDLQRGQIAGSTLDLALEDVNATLGRGLEPLALRTLGGRIDGQWLDADGGFTLATEQLRFETSDGLQWPGGNLSLRHSGADRTAQGALQADQIDLAALARIASRLPLDATLHQALARWHPQGRIEQLQAHWQGPLAAPRSYQLRAKVHGLALAADAPAQGADAPLGLSGVQLDLDLNQSGGRATLALQDGTLRFPGVFEDPLLPVQRLTGTLRWQIDGAQIALQAPDLRFANADAQGEAQLQWRTADPARSGARSRFPGVLQLTGTLARADGTRVHRYLPLAVPKEARHYVRDAVTTGSASQVRFRVQGDLHDFPYAGSQAGTFHISAPVKNVTYRYVPPTLLGPGERPWPALTGLAGQLVFDRASMQVLGASGSFDGARRLLASKVNARIPDLEAPHVQVDGEVRGPLDDMLALVRSSAIGPLTNGALDAARASGAATLQLGLDLPIAQLAQARVRGSVALAGNDVRFTPQAPLVAGVRGAVQFSDSGFTLAGVQGRALGGPVQFTGGMQGGHSPTAQVLVRAQGTASAEGLRAAPELGLVTRLAQRASGTSAYELEIGVRRGVPELLVRTDLRGLALDAPAPLGKSAGDALAVRVQNRLTDAAAASNDAPLHDQLTVDVQGLAHLAYTRAHQGEQTRVLAGAIALGSTAPSPAAPAALPTKGVVLQANLAQLDLDAWRTLLQAPTAATTPATAAADPAFTPPAGYLPTEGQLRIGTVAAFGRNVHDVQAQLSRQGETWQARLDARELNGTASYQPEGSSDAPHGRIQARLQRLALPPAAPAQADALLSDTQPSTLPALDVVVQDFTLHGRRLGALDIQAANRLNPQGQREWQLQRLNLALPEATFRSSGHWTRLATTGAPAQRTALDFTLDLRDAGALLDRLGTPGALRKGQGSLQGHLEWAGAPTTPDYPSMSGQVHVDVQTGQFLKADPGLAKLLSVLSLQSLPRRLALDFRDVFSQGFAFDFVRGDLRVLEGVAHTNNLQMKGVNAAVLMEGSANLAHETQNLRVVVIPEINAMTASLVATAINPVIGLGSFLAQAFLRGPLMEAATQEFHIDGAWSEPRVQRIERKKPAAAPGESP